MAAATLVWQTVKIVTLAPVRWVRAMVTLVLGNPVISREMKTRMRFARAFWVQGAYLLFLIAIVLLAYQGILAHSPLRHPAELQERLQVFYFILLYSLVTITVLIAPALTASALTYERERRTLDLLLATPLSPMQILAGKLLVSFAFLMLLLVESMPVVAVCLVMGGATVGDLLATYALIAFSILHLCAFALYCSACNRTSGVATFWAYLGVASILLATFWMAMPDIALGFAVSRLSSYVVVPLAALHPFAAPTIKALPTKLFGIEFPCWAFGIVSSLLLTRFWLTAAAAKLPAVYCTNFVGSLRRQALLLTLLAVLTFDAVLSFLGGLIGPPTSQELTILLIFAANGAALFLTPFLPWIATYGEQGGKPPANDGWFRPWRSFQPAASGALPFLWLWYALLVAVNGSLVSWRAGVLPLWRDLGVGVGYGAVCLTFFWAIGRFWSAIVGQLALARWVTFLTLLLLAILPGLSRWSLAYPFVVAMETTPASDVLQKFVQKALPHGATLLALTVLLAAFAWWWERARQRVQKVSVA